jgi:hypothetical protein
MALVLENKKSSALKCGLKTFNLHIKASIKQKSVVFSFPEKQLNMRMKQNNPLMHYNLRRFSQRIYD